MKYLVIVLMMFCTSVCAESQYVKFSTVLEGANTGFKFTDVNRDDVVNYELEYFPAGYPGWSVKVKTSNCIHKYEWVNCALAQGLIKHWEDYVFKVHVLGELDRPLGESAPFSVWTVDSDINVLINLVNEYE